MYCTQLNLKDFRNYRNLQLGFSRGLIVIQGHNAAGKTTLLEAIYLLATTKSPRARAEQEMVNMEALPEFGAPAFSRLSVQVSRKDGPLEAEILIMRDDEAETGSRGSLTRKRIKINGAPRRAVDLVGKVNVVLFSPEDLDLVIGSPSLRRRYLDITLSQTDHRYLRALQEYARVLAQRNGFLRTLKERQHSRTGFSSHRGELEIWDNELIKSGSYIIRQRKECLAGLNKLANGLHAHLTGLDEAIKAGMDFNFQLVYKPSFGLGEALSEADISGLFQEQLKSLRNQELQRGVSLAGPHRDDFMFMVEGADIGTYGSRGQQRTAVLALKLAEVGWMEQQTGDQPILMLDDILSELDVLRRQYVLETVQAGAEQVFITTTDLALFGDYEQLQHKAALYKVESRRVTRI